MYEAKDILALVNIPCERIKYFASYELPDFKRMRKRVLYINRNQKD